MPNNKQRQAAERMARELAKVLQEVATIFDGARLEALRREDPQSADVLDPKRLADLLCRNTPAGHRQLGEVFTDPRVAELERVIAELRTKLKDTEANLVRPDTSGSTHQSSSPQFTRLCNHPNTLHARMQPNRACLPPCPLPYLLPLTYRRDDPAYRWPASPGHASCWSALPTTCPAAFRRVCPAAVEPENT